MELIILLNFLIFSNMHLALSAKLNVSSQLIFSIGIFFYIITFEIWVWIKRIERIVSFRIFDKMDELYNIELKSKSNRE